LKKELKDLNKKEKVTSTTERSTSTKNTRSTMMQMKESDLKIFWLNKKDKSKRKKSKSTRPLRNT